MFPFSIVTVIVVSLSFHLANLTIQKCPEIEWSSLWIEFNKFDEIQKSFSIPFEFIFYTGQIIFSSLGGEARKKYRIKKNQGAVRMNETHELCL